MKISANCSRGVLYITLCGELDEHSARQTRMEADKLAEKYAHANRALFDLKGVSFMENQCSWHGKAPNAEEYENALKEVNI